MGRAALTVKGYLILVIFGKIQQCTGKTTGCNPIKVYISGKLRIFVFEKYILLKGHSWSSFSGTLLDVGKK